MYMDAVLKEVKVDGEDGSKVSGGGKREEGLTVMVWHFVEVCRKGLKVNADMSKVMVLGNMEGFLCEIHVDGM